VVKPAADTKPKAAKAKKKTAAKPRKTITAAE
jgi:hypothetical protein